MPSVPEGAMLIVTLQDGPVHHRAKPKLTLPDKRLKLAKTQSVCILACPLFAENLLRSIECQRKFSVQEGTRLLYRISAFYSS